MSPADVVLVVPRACPPEDGCAECARHGSCPVRVPAGELTTEEIAAILSLSSTCPVEAAVIARARAVVLAFLDEELRMENEALEAPRTERSAA